MKVTLLYSSKKVIFVVAAFLLLLVLLAENPATCLPTKAKNIPSKSKRRSLPASNTVNTAKITNASKQVLPFTNMISTMFNNKKSTTKEVTVIDYGSIVKYVVAMSVQVGLSFGMWIVIDWALQTLTQRFPNVQPSRVIKFIMVYYFNLHVGKFNFLPKIPERSTPAKNSPGRIRPSWTPPGYVFALMWPLFVFGTRAYTMVVIADNSIDGKFANPVMLSMMVHFSFASLWSSM